MTGVAAAIRMETAAPVIPNMEVAIQKAIQGISMEAMEGFFSSFLPEALGAEPPVDAPEPPK